MKLAFSMGWTAGRSLEPHRLDDHPHRGSRDHATSRMRARVAARQRDVLGDERRRASSAASGERSARRARRRGMQQRRPSPARAVSPRATASAGARSARSTATSDLAGAEVRVRAARQQDGRLAGAHDDPVRRTGRQQQDGPRSRPARGERAPRPVETPTSGMPEAVGQALGRRDPHAQAGEGARARPDDDPRRAASGGCPARPGTARSTGSSVSPWR